MVFLDIVIEIKFINFTHVLHLSPLIGTRDRGGICWRSLVLKHSGYAPRILEWEGDWATNNFAYWTESTWWETPSASIFVVPSMTWEHIVLSVGTLLTFCTVPFVMTFVINSATIFPNQ